jgi:hypothetical protein
MARDKNLLDTRNKEIRAAYNRLKSEEQIVSYGGRKIAIRLSYQQVLLLLSQTYFISTRRVEYVIGLTEPVMAPIISKPEQAAGAAAQAA